ncbi:2348_t:CDS:2 [Dentiscutata erythropus]|uniref:2348_t:CDS:1 n=1 Tax=Dentiscutata erythropus TaxID=1348616 RepID=A0A9N9FS94_9GLOM|nr:2348_t:CDS:2 [Dentiscutata erythropus]
MKPAINTLDGKFQIKLISFPKRKVTYLLENHIDPSSIDLYSDWISEATNFTENPLTDESPTNDIYLEIRYPKEELIFENETIKPSKELIKKVTEALDNTDTYSELMNVFRTYGHLIPKKVIRGHKLYQMKCSIVDKNLPRFNINEEDLSIECENENILSKWESLAEQYGFDKSYLVSIDGNIVMRDKLKEWADESSKGDSNLKIDDKLNYNQSNTKERVLMIGVIPIKNYTNYFRVNFSTPLRSSNYRIFGKVMTERGELNNENIVKFQSMDINGFTANFEIGIEELTNLQITWLLIGNPIEIRHYSKDARNIRVLYSGETPFPDDNNWNISLKVTNNLPIGSILVTSFTHSPSNYDPNFIAEVQYYYDQEIIITVRDLEHDFGSNNKATHDEKIQEQTLEQVPYNDQEEYVEFIRNLECKVQWCILIIPENLKLDNMYCSPITTAHLKAAGQIISNDSLILDLIKFQKLDNGLIINNERTFFTKSSVCRFKKQPSIEFSKGTSFLVTSKKSIDSFLLKNHINPVIFDNIAKFIRNILFCELPTNDIYLEIQCVQVELIFEKGTINPAEELIDAIKNALKNNNPYYNLMEVFGIYGQFLPKKLIFGHKLNRMLNLEINDASITTNSNNLSILKYFQTNDEFEHILDEWENIVKPYNIDASYLLSIDGKVVKRDKLREWMDSCLKLDLRSLQLISWCDLYPIYETFDDSLCQEVKYVLAVKERVLNSGVIPIEDNIHSYTVKFSIQLRANNYKIFGKATASNGNLTDQIIINKTFRDLKINWIMVGIPAEVGFFSVYTRNIEILCTGKTLFVPAIDKDNWETLLEVSESLPINSIIITGFIYPLSNFEPTFLANIQYYENNKISLNIKNLGLSNEKDSIIDSDRESYSDLSTTLYSESDDKSKISIKSLNCEQNYLLEWYIIHTKNPETMTHLKAIGQDINTRKSEGQDINTKKSDLEFKNTKVLEDNKEILSSEKNILMDQPKIPLKQDNKAVFQEINIMQISEDKKFSWKTMYDKLPNPFRRNNNSSNDDHLVVIIKKVDNCGNNESFIRKIRKKTTLGMVREFLEDDELGLGTNFYFLKKNLGRILRCDEFNFNLEDVLEINNDTYILHIEHEIDLMLTQLIAMCDGGFIYSGNQIQKAPKKAFKINLSHIEIMKYNQYSESKYTCNSELEALCKQNFMQDDLSCLFSLFEISQESSKKETKSYKTIHAKKAQIFIPPSGIIPTESFINDVQHALMDSSDKIKSNLFEISKIYGYFYANQIDFGGAVHEIITEHSKLSASIELGNAKFSSINENISSTGNYKIIIGGKHEIYTTDFGEWVNSLSDFQTWGIIGYNNIHSIFDSLDYKLRLKVLEAFGQRILAARTENIQFRLYKDRKSPHVYTLNIRDIPHYTRNCQIFTSIMTENEQNIFSSHVEYIYDNTPVVVIHHIDSNEKSKNKIYPIQLAWVVTGYPNNFTFDSNHLHLTFQSKEYSKPQIRFNGYLFDIPNCRKDECILATCILDRTLDSLDLSSSYKFGFAISTHFSLSSNSAYVSIYDIENNKPITDCYFSEILKLHICIIGNSFTKHEDCFGKINITSSDKLKLKIFSRSNILTTKLKDIQNVISKNIDTKNGKFSSPLFISQFLGDLNFGKYHGAINITPRSINFGSLDNTSKMIKEAQISYFCLSRDFYN